MYTGLKYYAYSGYLYLFTTELCAAAIAIIFLGEALSMYKIIAPLFIFSRSLSCKQKQLVMEFIPQQIKNIKNTDYSGSMQHGLALICAFRTLKKNCSKLEKCGKTMGE